VIRLGVGPALAGAGFGAALVACRSELLPISGELSRPELLAAIPPCGWFLSSAVAAAVLAWLASRRVPGHVFSPLLATTPAILPLLPGVVGVLPALASVSGWVLYLLVIGGVALSVLRFAETKELTWNVRAWHVALAAFVTYLAIGVHLQNRVGLSGDEPHYLVVVQSLLEDHDLRVDDEYAEETWQKFYTGKIRPHFAQPGRDGALYSIHGVGLPLLLLPGFAVLGLKGVLATEALMAALAVLETFRATELFTGRKSMAVFASVAFALTAPTLPLATMAYPELPAAFLAVSTLRRVLEPGEPGKLGCGLWGLVLGVLPFLHMKFLPLSLVLGATWVLRCGRARTAAAAGLAAGLALVTGFFFVLFGSPNPLAAYGRQRIFVEHIPRGFLGLLFDGKFGLLIVSPVYALGLTRFGSSPPSPAARFARWLPLAVFLSVALPGAAHPLWFGGSSPPARFLFPALGLLAVAAAGTIRESSWSRTFLIASVLLGGFLVLGPGQPLFLNRREEGGRLWDALGTSWELSHYFPSLVRADARSYLLAGFGLLTLLLAAVFRTTVRPRRYAPVAVGILLGFFLVDFFLPGAAPSGAEARFQANLLARLPELPLDRLRFLPAGRSATRNEVLPRIRLPLEAPNRDPDEEASSDGLWASAPFFVPAGEYRVVGGAATSLELCNGESCFGSSRAFTTRVPLLRFHVRAATGVAPDLHLEPLALGAPFAPALRSLSLGEGVRLHVLDDDTFYEPGGFWVRARARAELALESDGEGRVSWLLTNGSAENWIDLTHTAGRFRFQLLPREERAIVTPRKPGVERVFIETSSGFVPSSGSDRRPLGVFVRAAAF